MNMNNNKNEPGNTTGDDDVDDDGLKCADCEETYKNPKLLRCMHTFCEDCVNDTLLRGYSRQIVCPTCHYVTKVEQLPLLRNHVIQQMVKKQKLTSMREKNLLYCTECESDIATQLCCDCQWKLCSGCTSYHKKCVRYKDHNIKKIESVPAEALFEPESIVCEKHNQDLKYFCETCKTSTCNDCTHSKVHQGHFFRLMEEVIEERTESLKQLLQTSRVSCDEYEDYLKRIEIFQKTSKQEKENSRKVVEDTFNELINLLQTEKSKVLQWLGESYESSEKALRTAKEELKIVRSSTDYLDEVIKFPKEEISDIVFEGEKQLNKLLESMKKAAQQQPHFSQSSEMIDSKPTFTRTSPNPIIEEKVVKRRSERLFPEMVEHKRKKHKKDFEQNLDKIHGNVFNVNVFSRQINVSDQYEKIKLAIEQMSLPQKGGRQHSSFFGTSKLFGTYLPHAFTCDEKSFLDELKQCTSHSPGSELFSMLQDNNYIP